MYFNSVLFFIGCKYIYIYKIYKLFLININKKKLHIYDIWRLNKYKLNK